VKGKREKGKGKRERKPPKDRFLFQYLLDSLWLRKVQEEEEKREK